jgi:feruloyl esterase
MDAPWYIAGDGQNGALNDNTTIHGVPDYQDAKHDVVLAIMAWVENGTAPDSLIATKYLNDVTTDGVQRQRPICPFPQRATYIDTGDVDLPENWNCTSLY